ncbi:zona pellucida sperm-binding protein 3-like [Notolabrus celidotus]|uniref:zona pellucida sperm-binding protein 3-like n=1 Tax=Notolabrus celidotus TaxID=1203425 RepID=UPI00148F5B18|nr:zona pellucida sperm-binding protein 3-like [Notolabrus celidotus]
MWTAAHSASLLLLLMVTLHVADAIRLLKEGPMIDAEGREYKTLKLEAEEIREPQLSEESTVHVQCTESSMIIVVKADLFKTGHLVSPEELFLGEVDYSQSRCRAAAAGGSEYVIEAGLQDCGSILTIYEDSVIYSNNLIFTPAARYHGITRTAPAVIAVSCHYKRTHVVSSNTQPSPLTPSSPTQDSAFSLTLMNNDWTHEKYSTAFYLGDLLHLQASYTGPDSAHKQLFVDSCVATLSPDVASVPRYYFIENHGCLTEAKDGGSNTRFRPRTRVDVVQLQMDAFLFQQESRNSMFLTCQLRASTDMWRRSPVNKACNYVHSRWENIDGGDDVCQCCDSTCSTPSPKWRDISYPRPPMSEDLTACITLGPLMIYPRK